MSGSLEEIEETSSHQSRLEVQYEHCPNCQRRFFQGKLQLHLKLCSSLTPMLSPTRTSKPTPHLNSSKHSPCPHCHTKLPKFLLPTHILKYHSSTGIDSEMANRPPVSAKQNPEVRKQDQPFHRREQKEEGVKEKSKQGGQVESPRRYRVKLRQELSCLRLAQQVQKEECPSCGRMFSKQAALRHFPVCQKLTQQLEYQRCLTKKRKKGYSQSSPGSPRNNTSLLANKKECPLPPLKNNQSTAD